MNEPRKHLLDSGLSDSDVTAHVAMVSYRHDAGMV